MSKSENCLLIERITDAICDSYEFDKESNGYYDTPLTYLLRDIKAALSAQGEALQPAASGWGSLKEGDRVSCTDYGVIDSIDEEGIAAVVWEVSGCVGDVDLDRLVPASPPAPQQVQTAREGVLTDRQWMLLKKAADEGGIYPQPALPDHPGSWDGDVCALSEMGLLDTSQEAPGAPGRPRNVPGPKDGPRTAWHVLTEKGRAALAEASPS
ncbi:hypothetical protein [Allomesorhizobium alhagi]|uniref:Uncharacterized protein n=1 Tax=Mesorhizobium alhagi CCNWXJ12-2 TaxID=1107882 RepID=H0HQZ2_9HYPH|nr:hypothetical protein [Mesorhizobium alhagi]EHK56854.1 hypothetical protein MAXJ12_12872 [Mesorhizobium alhagi CCNWXJ12-2]